MSVFPTDPVTFLSTFVLFWGFLSVTAFLAARFVLGTDSVVKAVTTGVIPGFVVLISAPILSPVFVLLGFAVSDILAVWLAYREPVRLTIYLTSIHYAISILLGVTIVNLLQRA